MTLSKPTSGKSRTNIIVAAFLGIVTVGLLAVLLLQVTKLEEGYGYLRDNKEQIERSIAYEQKKYDALVAVVDKLEVKRAGLSSAVSLFQSRKGQLDQLKDDINAANKVLAALQNKASEARAVIADKGNSEAARDAARSDEKEAKEQISNLREKIDSLEKQSRLDEDTSRDAKSELNGLVRDVDRLNKRKGDLVTAILDLSDKEAKLQSIKADLEKIQKAIGTLSSQAGAAERRAKNAQKDFVDMRKDTQEAEKDLGQVRNFVAAKHAELVSLRQDVDHQEDVLAELQTARATLESTKDSLRNAEAELKKAQSDLGQAKDQARTLEAEADVVQTGLTKTQAQAATLAVEVAVKQKELDEAKNSLSAQQLTLSKVNSGISEKSQTEVNFSQRLEILRASVKVELSSLEQVQQELAQARADNARLSTDAAELMQLEATIDKRMETRDGLTAEVASKRAELESTQLELATQIRATKLAQAAATDAKAEENSLRTMKFELKNEIELLKKEQTQLQEIINSPDGPQPDTIHDEATISPTGDN